MNQIFDDAKDVHVRATLIYAKANDDYAYSDAAKTVKIDYKTLLELFHKGVIVIDTGFEYRPISCKVANGAALLTYVKADGTTATTAVLETISSSEYVAPAPSGD